MADGTAHYAEKVGDTQQLFNAEKNLLFFVSNYIIMTSKNKKINFRQQLKEIVIFLSEFRNPKSFLKFEYNNQISKFYLFNVIFTMLPTIPYYMIHCYVGKQS